MDGCESEDSFEDKKLEEVGVVAWMISGRQSPFQETLYGAQKGGQLRAKMRKVPPERALCDRFEMYGRGTVVGER